MWSCFDQLCAGRRNYYDQFMIEQNEENIMGSADFRIIPHRVLEAASPTQPDLYRYLISYVTSNPPRYLALDDDARAFLVINENLATRFPSAEVAQSRLTQAIELDELQKV
jgi:hypothetical protein